MIGGKGVNDPALVETLCSNSADAIDWLGEQGITLNSVSICRRRICQADPPPCE